ncbi:biotin--[acetyl-CoA-carboxylase] ligase [Rossellomorea aquimaris]|uniref:biotin--[acetyl-CoA-carboxylase] ligase n=1 Tax=Rossellomorea aquimaris TaxID=189382 RepID=UPI001CD21935|nr:biotin--[acetyl-CoA-carboxylase] ligase [Rossellomorea aquimaris]MCA1054615.1 biotin--[acetyl-CoA-carboxylase] ligase [Rossellomorea aquimaris]
MQSIRKKLIEAFSESHGEFLSGQALAEIAGCSRTAIWKHIEELRKEGFVLEAVRKKGYRIVHTPDSVTENKIRLGLQTSTLGQVIHYEKSVPSTQKIAHDLAGDGAAEGTLVIADEQTAGRGRLMREWHSSSGNGIWMSLILKPNLPPQKAPQFTLITAVAVVQAIEEVSSLEPEIKWPNDILINGKKVTGILTELQAESDRINSIIIGIGMNVNHTIEHFPDAIQSIATSLSIEEGKPLSRAVIVQKVLERMESLYGLYMKEGFTPIKLLWESYAVSIGKRIRARTINGTIEGTALGITEEGVLKIEDMAGVVHQIYSADIEVNV